MGPAINVGARFRQRKISVKQTLQILKQSDIPDFDADDQQRELQHIETGVEKGEEEEHHLQQVINASAAKFKGANVEQVYIPTPDASKIWNEASKYYTKKFLEPEPYIKFSATVEDTSGCPYNMDEIDEEFLNELNKDFDTDKKCTEDEFELIANQFDLIVDEKQPFLSMDPKRILSYNEIKDYTFNSTPNIFNPTANPNLILTKNLGAKLNVSKFKTLYDVDYIKEPRDLKTLFELFGELIYNHWKDRRIERGGKPVFPTLRFEDPSSQKDDNNPYTCFRRREFRQTRKTRRTDYQSIEKLKLLYKDIKRAESILTSISEREYKKLELLESNINIFNLRNNFKQVCRTEKITINNNNNKQIIDDLFVDKPKTKYKPLGYVPPPPPPPEKPKKEKDKISKNKKNDLSKKKKDPNQQNQQQQKLQQHNRQQLQHQLQQQQPKLQQQQNAPVMVQPYVKLPPSKIPDIELQTVNSVLKDKLEGIKKAVSDKLIKRKIADEGWINFTDDPYNPYFDISNVKETEIEKRNHLPYSSIISSTFEVENSREINFSHIFNNGRHYNNNDPEIVKINLFTGQVIKNDRHSHIPEFYDLVGDEAISNEFGETTEEATKKFNDKNRLNVSEVLFKVRKRPGRAGRIWVDRKRVSDDKFFEEFINFNEEEEDEYQIEEDLFDDKLDINKDIEMEDIEIEIDNRNDNENKTKSKKRRNAYDCSNDYKKRLKSRFMFDSDLPKMNPLDPSKLNQIGKQTQEIRFGGMLLTKAYDTMQQIRQKQIIHHQQKLQQQKIQQQREQKADELKRQQMQELANQKDKDKDEKKKNHAKEKKNKKDLNNKNSNGVSNNSNINNKTKSSNSNSSLNLSNKNKNIHQSTPLSPSALSSSASANTSNVKVKVENSINGVRTSSNGLLNEKVEKENKVV